MGGPRWVCLSVLLRRDGIKRTLSGEMIINCGEHLRDAISEGRLDDAMAMRKAVSLWQSKKDAGKEEGNVAKTFPTSHEANKRR